MSRSDDTDTAQPRFRPASLDALNFLLVDVNGAIRPYLNVYLFVKRGWNDADVGLVGTMAGLVGIALQTPIGAAIDAVRDKRVVLLGALVVLSLATAVITVSPGFWPVLVASCLMAAAGGALNPAIAALTLGLVPGRRLAGRMGRNSAFERAGNVAIALTIGAVGFLFPDRAVFLIVPAVGVLAAASLYAIPREAIDARRARGEREDDPNARPEGLRALLRNRPLLVFMACVMLFHFANGPLLTLVSQEIAQSYPDRSSIIVATCIVGAQAVMIPMALLIARYADDWGRKPLLLIGFCALPLRAVLYTLSRDPLWLIAVQLLDGVGAGLLSAAKPLVLADLMRGSGRYNLAHGITGTLQGAGASLSFALTGALVQQSGFVAAYLACGAAALGALLLLALFLPETVPDRPGDGPGAERSLPSRAA